MHPGTIVGSWLVGSTCKNVSLTKKVQCVLIILAIGESAAKTNDLLHFMSADPMNQNVFSGKHGSTSVTSGFDSSFFVVLGVLSH